MGRIVVVAVVVLFGVAPARAGTPVVVQDFEEASSLPKVWVVNIPQENASIALSTQQPHDGKQCLKLHYRFQAGGGFQYLGIPVEVKVQAPIHKLRFWLKGDSSRCSYGLQVLDAFGETHQYRSLSSGTGQGGVLDFTGWKEVVFDLDAPHETWGGDKNGRIDRPVTAFVLTVGQPVRKDGGKDELLAAEGDLSFDTLTVDSEKSADETLGGQIAVLTPAYGADVRGNTTVTVAAPGFKSLQVKCWKQGPGFGTDSTVATVALDARGRGSFVFPADQYPHGPVTVRLHGEDGELKDNCYLQLYNRGGVSWKEGLPGDPPAAKGMALVFADDFTGPLSIGDGSRFTYYDHKPPHGTQDFSTLRFTSFHQPGNPFHQVDTYLRIRADAKKGSAGLLSSLHNDGRGITAKAPCYFECRFLGPNAIGTWPAFWLLTPGGKDKKTQGVDELDIIEAYGGEGPRSPNALEAYMICPHAWNQGENGKALESKAFQAMHNPIRMKKFGIPSTWYEAAHTYGCKITATDTVYYCDDVEVGRHATLPVSKVEPFYFLIDLATGGGWPVDLSRYDGRADMYVDYVRVWQGK